MTDFSSIKSELNTNWNTGVIQNPTIYDKDIMYSAKYPHVLFLKVYNNMVMVPISQTSDGGLVRRKQFFKIHGVYDSYTNARQGLRESKRIVTEKQGWYIMGKANIQQSRGAFIFTLPCFERTYLQKSDW